MGRSGYTCVRRTFCTLNVLLWLSGCAVLGAGIWLHFAYTGYAGLLPQYSLLSADSLCIAVGVIIFIVAFFGCCGSWFQNRCMLVTYFSLVVFLFVLEFLMASVGFLFRGALTHSLNQELRVGISQHYNINPPNALATIWDHAHREFRCCGVNGHEDWYDIQAWPGHNYVPRSCCLSKFRNDTECGRSENPDLWFTKGCAEQVQMFFVQRLHFVGVIGLVVAFIQLFGLISSMLLFCTVKHKRSSHSYKTYDQA